MNLIYDSVTLLVSQLSVVNQSASALWVQVTRLESGAVFSKLFPAQTTQALDLSASNIHVHNVSAPNPAKPVAPVKAGLAVALRWPG